ncbi:hypothetical protein HYV85_04505 [Candidatus Woesearchaeota archaeon]|nr:hypothetical protein [Candidatus Woesearchaeota archaeon]
MGTMTISISDETEQKFREKVRETLGEGKGKLGRAVEESLRNWFENKEEEVLRQRALERLKKGMYRLPKDYKFRREEAYEERYRKLTGTH